MLWLIENESARFALIAMSPPVAAAADRLGLLLILRATCPMEVVARDFVATNADQVMSSLGLPARNRPARECLLELRNELVFNLGRQQMKV